MDAMIAIAARALAAGDVLGALNHIALRDDAPALALRGIAMARLGDLVRAKALLQSAARSFGAKDAVARARCVVAEAEIALVSRDLRWPAKSLESARATLDAHGDHANAAHAGHLQARRWLLIGRLADAEQAIAGLDPTPLPSASRAAHAFVVAGIAVRRLHIAQARTALAEAAEAAQRAGIAALQAEVDRASRLLDAPAARLLSQGAERALCLEEVEALFLSGGLVVDACRYAVRQGEMAVPLASRPVLFTLARVLAEAWPQDVPRDVLVARAFRARQADESYRARLRVEMGRLRTLLRPLAAVNATTQGFVLEPRHASSVVVLAPPMDVDHGEVLALLFDGESWSSSALALALSASQRTVQRALESLAAAGQVQCVGLGRSRRWMSVSSLPGFTTTLLLPTMPSG